MYNTRSHLEDKHGAKEARCESVCPVCLRGWEVQEQVVGGADRGKHRGACGVLETLCLQLGG